MNEPDEQVDEWDAQFYEETGKVVRYLLDPELEQREAMRPVVQSSNLQQAYLQAIANAHFGYGSMKQAQRMQNASALGIHGQAGLANALGGFFR